MNDSTPMGKPLVPAHSFLLSLDDWSAWGDLHSQGCSGLSRTGLLFPVNHAPKKLVPVAGLALAKAAGLGRRAVLFAL